MLNLIAIKTNKGYYLSIPRKGCESCPDLLHYYFDGINPQPTFKDNWVFTEQLPQKIQEDISQPSINPRYELIDKSMISEKIKEVFLLEEVTILGSEGRYWKPDYRHLESLYEFKMDAVPPKKEDVPFEIKIILEKDELVPPNSDFRYQVKTTWAHEGLTDILSESIQHRLLDEIEFPSIALHDKPCKLSSNQTFEIIRQYVKEHIDGRYAIVTSDYDFCFTVEKVIKKFQVQEYVVDVNNNIFQKRKRKPRYEKRYVTNRQIVIFEMAPAPYGKYSVIPGFEAKSENELKIKIDNYLKNMIDFINEPLIDCPHCKGDGVILDDTKPRDLSTNT